MKELDGSQEVRFLQGGPNKITNMSVTYKDFKRYNKNGYIVVLMDHHSSFVSGEDVCVYEHILVAEEILGRRLLEGEVVHHLDENKENNSPDNLLILQNPMHVKLHAWMDKNTITPNPQYLLRKQMGCIRCINCEIPIAMGFKFCSPSGHAKIILSERTSCVNYT